MYIQIYIYINICVNIYIYIYIHTYAYRERERDTLHVACTYVYMYPLYTYTLPIACRLRLSPIANRLLSIVDCLMYTVIVQMLCAAEYTLSWWLCERYLSKVSQSIECFISYFCFLMPTVLFFISIHSWTSNPHEPYNGCAKLSLSERRYHNHDCLSDFT